MNICNKFVNTIKTNHLQVFRVTCISTDAGWWLYCFSDCQ